MGSEADYLRTEAPIDLERGACYLVKEKKPDLAYRLFEMLLQQQSEPGPTRDERREFERLLYGLHAVLRLHFAQEEELYHALADE